MFYRYHINYEMDEDGVIIASCPAIRGCVASGKSLEEAYKNIKDAIDSCLQALRKVGREIPEDPFTSEGYEKYVVVEEAA